MMNEDAGRHPRELLSPYLDGELAADERARVVLHLEQCAACGALLDDLRVLASGIAAEEPPSPPADLAARIALRIGEVPRESKVIPIRRPVWRSPLMFGPVAAALAGIIVTVVWLSSRPPVVHRETTVAVLESAPPQPAARDRMVRSGAKEPAMPSPKSAMADQDAQSADDEGSSNLARQKQKVAPDASEMRMTIPPPAPEGRDVATGKQAGAETISQYEIEAEEIARGSAAAAGLAGDAGDPAIGKRAEEDGNAPATAPRDAPARTIAAPGDVAKIDSPQARSIGLVSSDYHAVLSEDGALTFRAGSYECVVPGFTLSGRADAAGRGGSGAEVGEIFELAAAEQRRHAAGLNEAKGETSGALQPARQVSPEVQFFGDADATLLYRATLTAAQEAGTESSPASIAMRIDRLIREHYLPLMESGCGTPPPELRTGGEAQSE